MKIFQLFVLMMWVVGAVFVFIDTSIAIMLWAIPAGYAADDIVNDIIYKD